MAVKTRAPAVARTASPAPDRVPPAAGRAMPAWIRRIRLRHLEVLTEIDRHGSLTAAARALDVTQPAVSQWLADIEAAVGSPLYLRGSRLRRTAIAGAVIAHAERVLRDARRTADEVDAIRGGRLGRVRIGAMQVATTALVPAAVRRLRAAQGSGVELSLVEDVAAGLWERFERDELDVLVTRLDARALASGRPTRRLFADRHRVVCAPDHPLVGRRRLDWIVASRHPWIVPPAGTPLRRALDAAFAAAGAPPPEVLLESASATANAVLWSVTRALGVISSTAAARLQSQGVLRALPLVLEHDIGDVGLVWREADPSPAVATVLAALEAVAGGARSRAAARAAD